MVQATCQPLCSAFFSRFDVCWKMHVGQAGIPLVEQSQSCGVGVIPSDRIEDALERFTREGVAAVVVMHDGQAAVGVRIDSCSCSSRSAERKAISFKRTDQLTDGNVSQQVNEGTLLVHDSDDDGKGWRFDHFAIRGRLRDGAARFAERGDIGVNSFLQGFDCFLLGLSPGRAAR